MEAEPHPEDGEDQGDDAEEDDEDDESEDEKHVPTFTSLPNDAWLDSRLTAAQLNQWDPTGLLASRRDHMKMIDSSMWFGFTETTVENGDTSYCYLCENPRNERMDTGRSEHYDRLIQFLRASHRVTFNLAVHWALRYYDEHVFMHTRKAMTMRMFLNHMLQHDPDPTSIHKQALIHGLDLHRILRRVVKPVDDGDAPNHRTVAMMIQNNRDIRASLKAMKESSESRSSAAR